MDDLDGLAAWMNGHFNTDLQGKDLQGLDENELIDTLEKAADEAISQVDLTPLDAYLVEDYPKRELAQWVSTRFGIEFTIDALLNAHGVDEAASIIVDAANDLYQQREVVYPIDFSIDMTNASMQHDPAQAIAQFCRWVKARYELDWTPETLPSTDPRELRTLLIEEAKGWDRARVEGRADRILSATGGEVDAVDAYMKSEIGMAMNADELESFADDPKSVLTEQLVRVMRAEVSQLEQWILLQILDSSWKEHLHQMDQLRESIGYRSFSQRDPKIEFKREGARLFEEMQEAIRDKVTDLVFKARLQPQIRQRSQQTQEETSPSPSAAATPPPSAPPQDQDQSAVAAAAAAASEGRRIRTGQPKRPVPNAAAETGVVGRNEPCPCGSGKKYKKCCGSK